MDVSAIVKAIDDRIATLQQAKDLLSATAVPATEKRAKAAVAALKPAASKGASSGRKPMSEEGRARIAAAQKKRWALKGATATVAKKATSAKAEKKAAPVKAAKKAVPAKKVAAKKAVPAEAPTPAAAEETAS